VSSYRSGMIAAEERLATVTTERDARGVDLVELELQWQAERAAHAETRKALEEERAANANAEQVSDALMDTRAELAKAKARVDTLKVLAISGMHTLLHVDADMTERVECAKAIAEPCGHPWPPYQEEEDEDG
jgi:predicted lipoprotein with Yx(FWY)xxD motif